MMAGQSRRHMAATSHLGAAARWSNAALDMSDDAIKSRARAAVKRAVASGGLIKPSNCEGCGDGERFGSDGRSLLHAHHHKGYDYPLDVEWLCVGCHFKKDPRPAGESNGRAKLTSEQVDEIKRRYRPGDARNYHPDCGRALAKEFGVDPKMISLIVRGRNWNKPDSILNPQDTSGSK